jgi:hypothetical protein
MILTFKERFRVSDYTFEVQPNYKKNPVDWARGPVLRVQVQFEEWQGGRALNADGFLDIGADTSIMSLRWIRRSASTDLSQPTGLRGSSIPKFDKNWKIVENVSFRIGAACLSFSGDEGLDVGWQEKEGDRKLAERINNRSEPPRMPGREDILIGRDVITRNKLLVLTDGDRKDFSILLPTDAQNKLRRARILKAFDPSSRFRPGWLPWLRSNTS